MNVFLAGATGAIGRPCLRILVARGHRVFATTRKVRHVGSLWAAGAIPVVLDVLEPEPLRRAMRAAMPDAVLHQLTDLAALREPGRIADALARNAALRTTGTAHLMATARSAGVRHVVAQSIAFAYAPGGEPHAEEGYEPGTGSTGETGGAAPSAATPATLTARMPVA